jgi:hypothetical protein
VPIPAPASTAEAVDMVLTGLRYLAAADPTALAAQAQAGCLHCRSGLGGAQAARTLAFSRSNSSGVMTPRSRRSASLASWSAEFCEPAASWT